MKLWGKRNEEATRVDLESRPQILNQTYLQDTFIQLHILLGQTGRLYGSSKCQWLLQFDQRNVIFSYYPLIVVWVYVGGLNLYELVSIVHFDQVRIATKESSAEFGGNLVESNHKIFETTMPNK